MLLNLLDNALKFTPPGGAVVARIEPAERRYDITVTDTGLGIADADKAHVFERFYRGERTARGAESSSVSTGAGLGLPIARWIAEMHGGKLVLERSDASGTTFAVTLPRLDAPELRDAAEETIVSAAS